jgi:hypothetical protein
MSCIRVQINIALVAIAASYLTLGVANSDLASSLWWVYAIISGGLASANLFLAYRTHRRR